MSNRKKITIEVNPFIESIGIHFDADGITAMAKVCGFPDLSDDFLIGWDECLKWSMASSQEVGDAEAIIANLRKLADALESWNK